MTRENDNRDEMPWWLQLAGFIFFCFFFVLIFHSECSEEAMQRKQTERILRSEGTIIDKEVNPSGYRYNFWLDRLEYMPDRYYFKVRLDDGSVVKVKTDAVKYMQTSTGERIKYKGY